jgi:rubrerythrin
MDNQQQSTMSSPPRAISSKDLLYLKDAMSWELNAFKKFHFHAQHVENEEIKQALENAGRMHQDHFQRLLAHLQVNNNNAISAMQNNNQLN